MYSVSTQSTPYSVQKLSVRWTSAPSRLRLENIRAEVLQQQPWELLAFLLVRLAKLGRCFSFFFFSLLSLSLSL